MRRQHRTKIVATFGPGTGDQASIQALFEAGVDVFRLNFSHGAHAEHKARLDIIRGLEQKFARPIAVMMDLQGQNCGSGPSRMAQLNWLRRHSFASTWKTSPAISTA